MSNTLIHQVTTPQEWEEYLKLMWEGMRKKDGLSPYTKEDFYEAGYMNYILKESEEIKIGVYAKQSPEDTGTLFIHRWTGLGSELPLLAQVVTVIEERAKEANYETIRLLVTTPEEEQTFLNLDYTNKGAHPNSTETEPLTWMEKNYDNTKQ